MELRGAVVGAECTVSAMRSLALLRCSVFECTDAKQETRIKGDASTRASVAAHHALLPRGARHQRRVGTAAAVGVRALIT